MQVIILGKHGLKRVDLNRKRAIFEYCLNCSSWSHVEIDNCSHNECPLHPFRSGIGKQDVHQRRLAIRDHCIWCSGSARGVKKCLITTCPLWAYRKAGVDRSVEVASFIKKGQMREQITQASGEVI